MTLTPSQIRMLLAAQSRVDAERASLALDVLIRGNAFGPLKDPAAVVREFREMLQQTAR